MGEADALTIGGGETVVLKYLSQQIAESTLTKIKSRLPLSIQPQPEIEPSRVVLDARNFQVVEAVALAADYSELQANGGEESGEECAKAEEGAEKSKGQSLDMNSMS